MAGLPVVSVLGNWESAQVILGNILQSHAIGQAGIKKANPTGIRSQIQLYNQTLTKLFRDLAEAEAVNAQAYSDQAMINFAFAREEALKNKNVIDMFLKGSHLWVQLKDIKCYISELSSTYDFGDFLVDFDMVSCGFRIYSTKYFIVPNDKHPDHKAFGDKEKYVFDSVKGKKYPTYAICHPHVRDGDVCMGNLGGVLAPVIAKYQFNVAIELITGYIQNCNMNDGWGRYGICWPLLEGPGIQAYTKELYPNVTEDQYNNYVRFGHGTVEVRNQPRPDFFKVLTVDSDEITRIILQLPDKRRTIADIVNENLVKEQPETVLETELLPISEEEAIARNKANMPVEYIAGVDEEGYQTQTPAIRVTPGPIEPVVEKKAATKKTTKPRTRKVA